MTLKWVWVSIFTTEIDRLPTFQSTGLRSLLDRFFVTFFFFLPLLFFFFFCRCRRREGGDSASSAVARANPEKGVLLRARTKAPTVVASTMVIRFIRMTWGFGEWSSGCVNMLFFSCCRCNCSCVIDDICLWITFFYDFTQYARKCTQHNTGIEKSIPYLRIPR